jgi:hypothetical protein
VTSAVARSPWRSRLLALVVASFLAATSSIARADARVALSVDAPDERARAAVRARIVAELGRRGFTVLPDGPPQSDDPIASMRVHARANDAVIGIVVRIDASGASTIDIVDRVTGKRLERWMSAPQGDHAPSEIAVATAELVDASLVELRLPQTVDVGEVDPPRDLKVPSAGPRHPRWQADGAFAVLWPVHERAPVVTAIVALGVRPTRRLGLAAEGVVPLHAFVRETDTATLRTYPFLAGARADVDVIPGDGPWRLDLGIGVSALALRLEVDAVDGVRGRPGTTWTGAALAGLTIHRRVARHASIGALVRVVAPFEDVRILVSGRTEQRFGPVWVGLGVSALARW